jgi:hypothetical protein
MQNYQNHRKLKPESRSHKLYYFFVVMLFILSVADLCCAVFIRHSGRINAVMFLLTSLCLLTAYFLFRSFALKAQDRAIRAEENLRHFALTGKLLNNALTIQQIIALRFASDTEFVALAERAVKENLSNNDIKKAVVSWREDNYRA